MRLLTPDYPPLRLDGLLGWSSEFRDQLSHSSSVSIVSGYVSEFALQALTELLTNASENLPLLRSFDLVLGMAYFDGLTSRQKMALLKLQGALAKNDLGSVSIPMFMKVHSKCSVFYRSQGFTAILGSTNLTALVPHRQSELDILIESPDKAAVLASDYVKKVLELSTPIDEKVLGAIPTLRSSNARLLSTSGVFTVIPGQAPDLFRHPGATFNLPLKVELKSNLNKFNAAPRGKIPRSWWEIELIVPTTIQRAPFFPSHIDGTDEFYVFTDDGYSFRCHVSGGTKPQSNKNFESSGDLKILGLWLKGRLVEAGCLDEGDFVTAQVLECYGRESLTMRKLESPNCWALDFSRKE